MVTIPISGMVTLSAATDDVDRASLAAIYVAVVAGVATRSRTAGGEERSGTDPSTGCSPTSP